MAFQNAAIRLANYAGTKFVEGFFKVDTAAAHIRRMVAATRVNKPLATVAVVSVMGNVYAWNHRHCQCQQCKPTKYSANQSTWPY